MRGTRKEESCPGANRSPKHGSQEARKKWQSMDIDTFISLLRGNVFRAVDFDSWMVGAKDLLIWFLWKQASLVALSSHLRILCSKTKQRTLNEKIKIKQRTLKVRQKNENTNVKINKLLQQAPIRRKESTIKPIWTTITILKTRIAQERNIKHEICNGNIAIIHAEIIRVRLIVVMPTCWSTYQKTYHQSRRKSSLALDDDLSENDYYECR